MSEYWKGREDNEISRLTTRVPGLTVREGHAPRRFDSIFGKSNFRRQSEHESGIDRGKVGRIDNLTLLRGSESNTGESGGTLSKRGRGQIMTMKLERWRWD